jgi:hypothetical protein
MSCFKIIDCSLSFNIDGVVESFTACLAFFFLFILKTTDFKIFEFYITLIIFYYYLNKKNLLQNKFFLLFYTNFFYLISHLSLPTFTTNFSSLIKQGHKLGLYYFIFIIFNFLIKIS